MSLEIIFSDDASDILLSITNFIEHKWGKKAADKFLTKTYKTINLTAKNPHMFKASAIKENVRIGLITKQTSFFYQIEQNSIIILFFWDNRQQPIING